MQDYNMKHDEEEKVVSLRKRDKVAAEDHVFGVHISESDNRDVPANETTAVSPKNTLVVDETQPYVIADRRGVLLRTNDKYRKLYKMADGNALAGSPDLIGRGPVRALLDVIEDVLASESTVRTEEHVEIGGKEHILLVRHIPARLNGPDIDAIAITYEDISRQVHAMRKANLTEARFRDFARASSDWFFECDRAMRFTHLSERFTASVGQPSSLFIGAGLDQIGEFKKNIDGEDLGPRSINRRKPFRDQLFVVEGNDTDERLFHLSAVPIFNRESGNFKGYRGVGMDVTDRYAHAHAADEAKLELEDLLRELTKKNIALDRANDAAQVALATKNDFLATMSHELRTPLNAIIGFASSFEIEAFGALTQNYKEYAADIRTSGEHLLGLINDILDVAVLEAGDVTLRLDHIATKPLLQKTQSMTEELLVQKELTYSAQYASKEVKIVADERRVTQILMNLLSNAIKFTPENGELGIRETISRDGSLYRLTVWDSGVGIAIPDQDRVFNKFVQIKDDIYSREQEGTGLGLHISRELARRMNGDISLKSKEGEGSAFTLTLPIASNLEAEFDLDEDDDRFI